VGGYKQNQLRDNTHPYVIYKIEGFIQLPNSELVAQPVQRAPKAHAFEVSTAVFNKPIFRSDQRIKLARPAVNATMTLLRGGLAALGVS
jgi:hypothetical protein